MLRFSRMITADLQLGRWRRLRGVVLRDAVVVTVALVGQLSATLTLLADDQATDAGGRSARLVGQLAETLLRHVPAGASIAVHPFHLHPLTSLLPKDDGGQFYDALTAALLSAAQGRVSVLPRAKLLELFATREEFFYDESQRRALFRELQADFEVYCDARVAEAGVVLSCQAFSLAQDNMEMVASGFADFPLEPLRLLNLALFGLSMRVVRAAPAPGALMQVRFIERGTGCESELGSYLGAKLEGWARAALETPATSGPVVVTGEHTPPAANSSPPGYRLEGYIWRHDQQTIELEAGLRTHRDDGQRGELLHTGHVTVATASLPAGLARPPALCGAGGQQYQAQAEAQVSAHLDRVTAVRGARNLARARVVAQALGLRAPGVDTVTTAAGSVAVLTAALAAGLPVQERFSVAWEGDPDTAQRAVVQLTARVVPIGLIDRPHVPKVTARLHQQVYRAWEPITIEITSTRLAYLGVFAWGADDKVVRVYPSPGSHLAIAAGQQLLLPRLHAGDGYIVAQPLPGNARDHEAFVIVATPHPANFAALMNPVGRDSQQTMEQARESEYFLEGLAKLEVRRMALVVLPYEVRR